MSPEILNAFDYKKIKIAVIGLGYVGLPLAIEFAKKYNVLGFDINRSRVEELARGIDRTQEANIEDLLLVTDLAQKKECQGLYFSDNTDKLKGYDVFIVTVPTPVDQFKAPDLSYVIKASEMVGAVLKQGDIIIYESTVFPGCTEDECVPVLEKFSGLKFNEDFYCGYSPERINPGDKINTLTKIKKITSGSNPAIAMVVDDLYASIITAGTHKAPSIKIAEAAKAIENAQRDINISFVNELALIFDKMDIDTNDVLEAAATKWNFLRYKPGLVGGHCIGVDSYYLAHKAKQLGYYPEVISSGRKVNDQMGLFVANKVIKLMLHKGKTLNGAKVLILGFTFKENCPDIRNTKVADIYYEMQQFGLKIDVFDPWASATLVQTEYGITLQKKINTDINYQALIIAVAHNEFLDIDYSRYKKQGTVIYDIKSFIDREFVDDRL